MPGERHDSPTIEPMSLIDQPLQIVSACRARDLPILELTISKLPQMIACEALHVIAPQADCLTIQKRMGRKARVIPEQDFLPGMNIEELRAFSAPGFPQAAGWYLQQFLKLQFAFFEPEKDYYLIWDADTVPLRPMRFFDEQGRMLLTKAEEYQVPYFETYRRILGEEPNREFSFIAQHILVQKSVAREMLAKVDHRVSGGGGWPWKIIRSLPESGRNNNLFSEYETYGHYVKNHYPDRVKFIRRSWLRKAAREIGRSFPSQRELKKLSEQYDYVAFERVYRGWRRFAVLAHGLVQLCRSRKKASVHANP